jgi:hypothetical protein
MPVCDYASLTSLKFLYLSSARSSKSGYTGHIGPPAAFFHIVFHVMTLQSSSLSMLYSTALLNKPQ